MRQAGRYLPEYRRVREGVSVSGDVLATWTARWKCRSSRSIWWEREAVILFSDIFVPIPAMGVDVDFLPGPTIEAPIRTTRSGREACACPIRCESVPFVFDILRVLRSELASAAACR